MTIRNYSDHAANERTFLAWVRTAIAVIAFGFLVERFDLFAGLTLIVMGMATIGVATWRFARTAREIDDQEVHNGTGARTDFALAALLIILGLGLLFYLYHALSAQA
jgi:putative membrane protein